MYGNRGDRSNLDGNDATLDVIQANWQLRACRRGGGKNAFGKNDSKFGDFAYSVPAGLRYGSGETPQDPL